MMVGRIVPQVEGAEAGTEAADAEIQLVGDAVIDVPHRHLEAVATVTNFDVGREVVGDIDRHLERHLGDEAVERICLIPLGPGGELGREERVIELRRAGEVSLEAERRTRRERCQGSRNDEKHRQ
jgi:hypothetical protein